MRVRHHSDISDRYVVLFSCLFRYCVNFIKLTRFILVLAFTARLLICLVASRFDMMSFALFFRCVSSPFFSKFLPASLPTLALPEQLVSSCLI